VTERANDAFLFSILLLSFMLTSGEKYHTKVVLSTLNDYHTSPKYRGFHLLHPMAVY